MNFEEVIGQEDTKKRLMQMVEERRLPHAVMLCGPTGSGKMALALAFASYLLGDGPMLKNFGHPDLHFSFPVIKPAGTSSDHKMISDDFIREWHEMLAEGPYFTMDQWLSHMRAANQQAQIGAGESDALIRKLSLKSSQGGYKVCVMWLPERMNGECANKILKLLEEPPQQTVFLLVCEEPEHLIDTIYSRVQRIDLKRIDDGAIERALVERRGLEPDMARRVAHIANGSWLKAIEELNTDSEHRQFLDMFVMLMRLAYQRNIKELKNWTEAVAGFGREKQKRLLGYFLHMTRENFMYNFHRPELNYMTREEEDFSKNFARFINETNVIDLSETLQKAQRDIGQNANAKIVFFDLALNMIVLLLRK
ncbi:DNA polymerase III subunit delta [Prevotella sp. oral taxon 376]|uniref:DNA polymerase III subunit n=1 Tax=Prevotella sp. oral taxon 376 TaxID=712466 RepID=UPI000D1D6A02|nr:DNA polymerase III subunit delta [Prevotella sp. oral taxon 376]PTL34186.1 DNA polymerase III subunit delta [Prevotella sp. oral taxon 376]